MTLCKHCDEPLGLAPVLWHAIGTGYWHDRNSRWAHSRFCVVDGVYHEAEPV